VINAIKQQAFSRPDDPLRQVVAHHVLSQRRYVQEHFPGGTEAFAVNCAVALHNYEGRTANLSSVAEMTGLSRRTVARILGELVEGGWFIKVEANLQPWPTYVRTSDPDKQAFITNMYAELADEYREQVCDRLEQV